MITLSYSFYLIQGIRKAIAEGKTVKEKSITVESAQQIAVEFLKKRKSIERVDVSAIEQNKDIWVIRGTCPIDLEGHPWAEKFEVVVDTRGKIRTTTFALL
jgi:hypothetical protein